MLVVPAVTDRNLPRLLRRLGSVGDPTEVEVVPEAGAQLRDCFPNVLRKVDREGGSVAYGWQIWTWPRVLIEGEFHAVWRSPDGKLIDITPKEHGERGILFVPDVRRIWSGRYVDNVRLALKDDQLVAHLVALSELAVRLAIEADAAHPGETAEPTRDQLGVEAARGMVGASIAARQRDHDRCPCGRGGKYKRCCGVMVENMLAHFSTTSPR